MSVDGCRRCYIMWALNGGVFCWMFLDVVLPRGRRFAGCCGRLSKGVEGLLLRGWVLDSFSFVGGAV